MNANQLLEKIYSLTDVNEITDVISHFFKKPVVVENEQFALLAYSSYYIEQFDQANQQTIFSKSWTSSILNVFKQEGIVDQLKRIPKPFRIKPIKAIGLNQRVVVSAKHHHQILGYIWIQETDPLLSDDELDLLLQVSFHVGKLLYQKNQIQLKRNEKKNQFFMKMVDQTYRTDSELKWEAAQLNIALPSSFLVTVFKLNEAQKEKFDELHEEVMLFAHTLDQPVQLFTSPLQVIIMIGGADGLTETANKLIHAVKNQLMETHFFAGIGTVYSSISMMRKSYLEAVEVCDTAQFLHMSDQSCFEFQKLGVLRYLETISHYHAGTHYVNEDLLKLQQKDQDGHSDLLGTLDAYLQNNCRLKPTAQQLFIHTNTLKYRLKQMAELTSIDFEDVNTRCQLFIDLQLMKREQNEK